MRKTLIIPLLVGAAIGIIIGLLTAELGIWLAVGAGGGLLVGLFLSRR